MGRGKMPVEVPLADPIFVKHQQAGIVGGDMQIVIDAALLRAGWRAQSQKRLAQRVFLAGARAMERNHRDFSKHGSVPPAQELGGRAEA